MGEIRRATEETTAEINAACALFMAEVERIASAAYDPAELASFEPDDRQAMLVHAATIAVVNQRPEIPLYRRLHGLGMASGQAVGQTMVTDARAGGRLQGALQNGYQAGLEAVVAQMRQGGFHG